MRPAPDLPQRLVLTAAGLALFALLGTTPCLAAATINQQIDPPEVNVGDEVNVIITVQNGSAGNIHLPPVDGLELNGTSIQMKRVDDNGNVSSDVSFNFSLVATRAGDFTIPAFDVHLDDGGVLRTQAMKVHVLSNGNAPSSPIPTPAAPSPPANNPSVPTFNPNGPVVMPPSNATPPPPDNPNPTPANSDTTTNSNATVPTEIDGRPAKVFMILTPQTTDAYVGQSIPLRIDFYLRLDVAAQQDSLPTIKGSNFLMNNLSVRPQQDEPVIMNEQYERESWVTAVSAPQSGDFPLQMERDTYWTKSTSTQSLDPFGNFFIRRPNLAHELIGSNQLTVHVRSLPQEGRPANFTGAIGQFKVIGTADPLSVTVGEPVTLHFTVSGQGNFSYIRCPSLTEDPAWKSYVASSKTDYLDESHTQGTKTFDQAVIPQKNGTLPLPQANFSYFDPNTKQYVTVPLSLPTVTVTGSALPAVAASADSAGDSTAVAASPMAGFLPNRASIGSPRTDLSPVYRQTWFWAVQGGFLFAFVLGALFTCFHSRTREEDARAEREKKLRQLSLHQEEDAMGEAVRRGDALAFFLAARHAIQLQLGEQWRLSPEAITLGEIRQRDPQLALTLEPLFTQADEVIYSGRASSGLDLAHWERHVRELLQPQLQTA